MNKAQFYQYLAYPELLDDRSLGEIEAMLREFPYFQSARLLYIKNLNNQGNIIYDRELKSTAVWITDRSKLFNLLDKRVLLPVTEATLIKPELTNTPSVNLSEVIDFSELSSVTAFDREPTAVSQANHMDDELSQLIMSGAAQASNLFNVEDTVDLDDFLTTFGKKGKKQPAAESNNDFKGTHRQKLIDTFIQDQPRIKPKSAMDDDVFQPKNVLSKEDSDMMTDTLAKIYIKQGKYEKAISAYEKLSLKYPEKNIYFAGQIQKIKQIINNQ